MRMFNAFYLRETPCQWLGSGCGDGAPAEAHLTLGEPV